MRRCAFIASAVLITFKVISTQTVPFIIISVEIIEFVQFCKILKEKPYNRVAWIVFYLAILHIGLFNFFEVASLRYAIIASFIIEVFIVLLTGEIHLQLIRAILLLCPFLSTERKKQLK
jgi:hypothetical protein